MVCPRSAQHFLLSSYIFWLMYFDIAELLRWRFVVRQATDDDIRAVLLEVKAAKTKNKVAPPTTEYLRPAGVAALIRTALKKQFPGSKFRVRSDRTSVTVSWIDGPPAARVKEVA